MAVMLRACIGTHGIKTLAVFGLAVYLWMTYHLNGREPPGSPAPQLRPPLSVKPPDAAITPSGPSSSYPEGVHPDSISDANALQEFCSNYQLPPHMRGKEVRRRKIYDVLLVGAELEMLEVRLGTMAPHVDYFLVVESPRTLQNSASPKTIYVQEHWDRFKPWHSQLLRLTMDDADPAIRDPQASGREYLARDATFRALLRLPSSLAPAPGDILLSGDVDELWRGSALRLLRNCDTPDRVTARTVAYSYSFQWREAGSGAEWLHPQATTYNGPDTLLPTDLRYGRTEYLVRNGGWHCSWCFGTLQEMMAKLAAYGRSGELGEPRLWQPQTLVEKAREGIDIFGRGQLDRVDNNTDVPPFVLANRHLYGYMLDRDGPAAGFRDYVAGREAGEGR